MREQRKNISSPVVLGLAVALAVGAAVLIVSALGRSNDNGTAAKVLPVVFVLILLGPSAIMGVLLAERQPRLAAFGYLTAALGVVAFVAIAIHIVDGSLYLGGDWHLQGAALALALAAGQVSLVLAYGRRDDPPPLRLLALGTAGVIAVFGVLAAYEASSQGTDLSEKLYLVLGTLYLLGAALLILFRAMGWLDRRNQVGPSLQLDHAVIAISDRAAAIRFYTVLLGAELVERPDGHIAFRLGDQLLNVHEPDSAASPLARLPVQPGNSDLCFRWPAAPELAVTLIHELGAELVDGPVQREGAGGQGQSVYTRDPDGSLIELIAYGG